VLLILVLSPVVVLLSLVGLVLPPLLVSKLEPARAPAWVMLCRVAFVGSVGFISLLWSVFALWLHVVASLVVSIIVSCLIFFWILFLLLARLKRVSWLFSLGVFIALSFFVFFAVLLLSLLLLTFLFFLLFNHLKLLRRLDLVDRSDEGSDLGFEPLKISTSEGLTLACVSFVILLDRLVDLAEPYKPSHSIWLCRLFLLSRNFRSLPEL